MVFDSQKWGLIDLPIKCWWMVYIVVKAMTWRTLCKTSGSKLSVGKKAYEIFTSPAHLKLLGRHDISPWFKRLVPSASMLSVGSKWGVLRRHLDAFLSKYRRQGCVHPDLFFQTSGSRFKAIKDGMLQRGKPQSKRFCLLELLISFNFNHLLA